MKEPLQESLAIGHEEAHRLIGFRLLVSHFFDAVLVEAQDLRPGNGQHDGGVRGHDELRPMLGQLVQLIQKRELP